MDIALSLLLNYILKALDAQTEELAELNESIKQIIALLKQH